MEFAVHKRAMLLLYVAGGVVGVFASYLGLAAGGVPFLMRRLIQGHILNCHVGYASILQGLLAFQLLFLLLFLHLKVYVELLHWSGGVLGYIFYHYDILAYNLELLSRSLSLFSLRDLI